MYSESEKMSISDWVMPLSMANSEHRLTSIRNTIAVFKLIWIRKSLEKSWCQCYEAKCENEKENVEIQTDAVVQQKSILKFDNFIFVIDACVLSWYIGAQNTLPERQNRWIWIYKYLQIFHVQTNKKRWMVTGQNRDDYLFVIHLMLLNTNISRITWVNLFGLNGANELTWSPFSMIELVSVCEVLPTILSRILARLSIPLWTKSTNNVKRKRIQFINWHY